MSDKQEVFTAVDLEFGEDTHEHDNYPALLLYIRDNLPHEDRPYMVSGKNGPLCFVYKEKIFFMAVPGRNVFYD